MGAGGPGSDSAERRGRTYIDRDLRAIRILYGRIITLDPFVVHELSCQKKTTTDHQLSETRDVGPACDSDSIGWASTNRASHQ